MTRARAGRAVAGLVTAGLLAAGLLCTAVPALASTGLDAAREELRLRTQTERRMREEFESLLANGRMTAAEIADFEDYLVRLATMVDEQRRVVAQLQGTGTGDTTSPAAPLPGDFDRGQTDAEKIAMLDAELGQSLSEFDEKLLREQKEISEKSRAASTGDAGGADGAGGASGDGAEGEGRGQQAGGEADGQSGSSGNESTAEGGKEGETSGQQAGTGKDNDGDGEETRSGDGSKGSDQVASAEGAGGAGHKGGDASRPSDIGDGEDDDIVARQLREAAENEQDPELREKLWEEYRKYKKRSP